MGVPPPHQRRAWGYEAKGPISPEERPSYSFQLLVLPPLASPQSLTEGGGTSTSLSESPIFPLGLPRGKAPLPRMAMALWLTCILFTFAALKADLLYHRTPVQHEVAKRHCPLALSLSHRGSRGHNSSGAGLSWAQESC